MKLKTAVFGVILLSGSVLATPNKLNSCLGWFSVYEQFHIENPSPGIMKARLELAMKLNGDFNINQVVDSMDLPIMKYAAESTRETDKVFDDCTLVAQVYLRTHN